MPTQKQRPKMIRPRPRDRLHAHHTALLQRERIPTQDQLRRRGGEVGKAGDREVFVVEVWVV